MEGKEHGTYYKNGQTNDMLYEHNTENRDCRLFSRSRSESLDENKAMDKKSSDRREGDNSNHQVHKKSECKPSSLQEGTLKDSKYARSEFDSKVNEAYVYLRS